MAGVKARRVILTPMIETRIAFQCAKTSLMKALPSFLWAKKIIINDIDKEIGLCAGVERLPWS